MKQRLRLLLLCAFVFLTCAHTLCGGHTQPGECGQSDFAGFNAYQQCVAAKGESDPECKYILTATIVDHIICHSEYDRKPVKL